MSLAALKVDCYHNHLRSQVPHAVRSSPVTRRTSTSIHTCCRETHEQCTSVPSCFSTHVLATAGCQPGQQEISSVIETHRHCMSIALRSDQARGCSISRWVDQSAPIEVLADEVVAEHSPLHRHMTLAHWHTEVCHWHTCATEVCQTKSSRSGLKLTAHRVSARSEEVAKSWHTGTPKSHQPCFTADHVGAEVSVRACGARSVCGSSFFFQ